MTTPAGGYRDVAIFVPKNDGVGRRPTDSIPRGLGLNGDQRNAYEAVMALFKSYGLDSLAPKILEFVKQGFDGNTIGLMLQETKEFKQRFAGNEARRKQGLGVLSPAEYLGLERSYEQIMRSAGLPPGFYDNPSDFSKFIGLDVSPAEINDRVQGAIRFINDANPEARSALAAYYPELGVGDLAANFLDPSKAMPLIDKKIKAAEIGAAATRQGLSLTNELDAERYADIGVGAEQARAAYGRIAEILPDTTAIAERFGQTYDQQDGEQELLGGMASARRKREQLYQSESSLFSGGSGAQSRSLGGRTGGSY